MQIAKGKDALVNTVGQADPAGATAVGPGGVAAPASEPARPGPAGWAARLRTTGGAAALAVFCLVCLGYGRSVGYGFCYDDLHSVAHNPHLRDLRQVPAFFVDPSLFSADPHQAMYRPVLLLTYALDWQVGGPGAAVFHLTNVLLHALTAALVALLAGRLLGLAAAWWAGLWFAVQPLNVEAANYISSRSDTLMTALVLGACLAYLRYRESGQQRWWAVTMIAALAALGAKSTAVCLPALLAVCDHLQGRSWRRSWRAYAGVLLLAAVYVLATGPLVARAMGTPVRSLSSQFWTQAKAALYYLYLAAMPVRLSVEHAFVAARGLDEVSVAAAVLCAASLALVGWCWRRGPTVAAGGWAAAAWAPVAVVPLIVLVNEHRLYLPLVGGALGSAVLLGRASRPVRLAWMMVLGLLALLAWQRAPVWAGELPLWRDAAAKGPQVLKAQLRLGDALAAAGRPQEAEAAYRQALALRPEHPGVRNNLGSLLLSQGRLADAEAEFRAVLAVDPRVTPAVLNLGSLLLRRGDWQAARDVYSRAAANGGTAGEAERQLAQISLRFAADPAAAAVQFGRALEQGQSGNPGVWCGRGVALAQLGRLAEAEAAYQQALRLDAGYAEAWYNLGNLLVADDRRTEAAAAYRRAVAQGASELANLARQRLATLGP
jgi:Flp pilus assembly protein TadD